MTVSKKFKEPNFKTFTGENRTFHMLEPNINRHAYRPTAKNVIFGFRGLQNVQIQTKPPFLRFYNKTKFFVPCMGKALTFHYRKSENATKVKLFSVIFSLQFPFSFCSNMNSH